MIIDSFERNAEDMVVAICGDTKHLLSWEFILNNKPQVGDVLSMAEEGLELAKQEEVKTEELFAAIEPEVIVVDPVI